MTPSAPPEAADALALAHFVRDAVTAGQVRDVLHLRLAGMAPGLRRRAAAAGCGCPAPC